MPDDFSGPHNWATLSPEEKQKITASMTDLARAEPATAINSYPDYKAQPYARFVVQAALQEAPSIYFNRYKFLSSQPELQNLYGPENQTALKTAAISHPLDFLTHLSDYKTQGFVNPALSAISTQNPEAVFKKAGILEAAGAQSFIGQAFASDTGYGLGAIHEGWLHFNDVPNVGQILSDKLPNFLAGPHNPDATLTAVNYLNTLHEEAPAIRFQATEKLNAGGFYTMLSEGRSEAYTSTFNYLFNHFSDDLKKDGKNLDQFLHEKPERLQGLPQFIDGVSSFGRFKDLTGTMDTAAKMTLADTILNGDHPSVNQGIAMANMVRNLPKGDPVLSHIEGEILHGYANAGDPKTKDLYGVLGNWYASASGQTPSAENAAAFKKLSSDNRYQLPDFQRVDSNLLFDKQNRHFQMHLFYNDTDGVTSYDFFKQRMEKEGWNEKIDQANGISHFSKTNEGRSVNIYATIPSLKAGDPSNTQAADKIRADVASQGGTITFVAHRGHSYHVNDSIAQLSGKEQIVYLGACGGTEFISSTLGKSPQADIIATSGEGTKYVNEPLLGDINNRILKGQSIEWNDVGKTVAGIGDSRAQFYMMPSQNMAAVFISKMNSLENDEKPVPAPSALNGSFSTAAIGAPPALPPNTPASSPPVPVAAPILAPTG